MKISLINTNQTFGKVTTEAAKRALDTANYTEFVWDIQDNVALTKALIAKGHTVSDYNVSFNKEKCQYYVYPTNEDSKKTMDEFCIKSPSYHNSFKTAIEDSLDLQAKYNAACVHRLCESAKKTPDKGIFELYTVPQ